MSVDVSSTVACGGATVSPQPALAGAQTSSAEAPLFAESRTPADLAAQGYVTDASGLTFVRPATIVVPTSVQELQSALAVARQSNLRFSVSGTRHAMGGQALQNGSVLADMRSMDAMGYDPATGLLTVQPGATWSEVQGFLDPLGRSVAVMQSSNIFSVGGSLAVNAHGRDVRFGPIGDTVASLTVMLPDGRIVGASRTENPELFRHVIGGYGQFGTIVEARIQTVPNELYRRVDTTMAVDAFPAWWQQNVHGNPDARLLQARLSIAPHNLLDEVHVISYEHAGTGEAIPQLRQKESWPIALWEKASFAAAEHSSLGREALWWMEKHLDPLLNGNKLVSRNQAMSPDVEFLRSGPSDHTQVLQEYFVPRERLPQFVEGLRAAALRHDIPLLNATVRDVPRDTTSALPYAPSDSFSVVLYFDQATDATAQSNVDAFAREAADAALGQGGTMYLPYRLSYTDEQIAAAYPTAGAVAAARAQVDPAGTMTNSVSDVLRRTQ